MPFFLLLKPHHLLESPLTSGHYLGLCFEPHSPLCLPSWRAPIPWARGWVSPLDLGPLQGWDKPTFLCEPKAQPRAWPHEGLGDSDEGEGVMHPQFAPQASLSWRQLKLRDSDTVSKAQASAGGNWVDWRERTCSEGRNVMTHTPYGPAAGDS